MQFGDGSGRTYLAGSDDVADVDGQGEVSCPNGLHQEQVLLLGLLCQLLCLRSVDGESLLAEDVLSTLKTEHGILVVVRVRCSNVDYVNVLVGNQLFIRSVALC